MRQKIYAKAASNIALLKYMGKKDSTQNIPINPSISLTLCNLCTIVELEWSEEFRADSIDFGLPNSNQIQDKVKNFELRMPSLSEKGKDRMLRFARLSVDRIDHLLKQTDLFNRFDLAKPKGFFKLKTANTFPEGSGLASSASSFAAVTLALARSFFKNEKDASFLNTENGLKLFSTLSRLGSGSSCRSFLGPWVKWEQESISKLESTLEPFVDLVLMVSTEHKKVGSSEAHLAVQTSPLWEGRVDRTLERATHLEHALQGANLRLLSSVSFEEYIEMHSLFHTSKPFFSYWQPRSMELIQFLSKWVLDPTQHPSGIVPIVTMDAGPNVHVLVPRSQKDFYIKFLSTKFKDIPVLVDDQGTGPECWVESNPA